MEQPDYPIPGTLRPVAIAVLLALETAPRRELGVGTIAVGRAALVARDLQIEGLVTVASRQTTRNAICRLGAQLAVRAGRFADGHLAGIACGEVR